MGEMVVSQVWQVTLLAVVVAVVVRVLGQRRPQLACLLWMLVLVKCLTPWWKRPSKPVRLSRHCRR
jgi:hypothetical protein